MSKQIGKQIKLYQDIEFSLSKRIGRDGDPRPDGIDDVMSVSDKDASIVYISGYASVFLDENGKRYADRDGESVNTSLLDIEEYKQNPVVVNAHDWSDVMGRVTSIEKTSKGLYVEAEIHRLTGRENIFEAVQKGLLKTFSIGFVPYSYTYIENDDVLEITTAKLVEISLMAVPSNGQAIFTTTGQKSITVPTKTVKEQNGLTCDEMSGLCGITKTIKGKEMDIVKKEVEVKPEPKAEVKPEPKPEPKEEVKPEPKPEPKEEVKPEPKAEVKPEPKAATSVDELAAAIASANELAEAKKAQKEADAQAEKEAAEKAEQDAITKRIEDSINYIKERKASIEATEAGDLDIDELSDFYELLSDTVDVINGKVTEAVSAQ